MRKLFLLLPALVLSLFANAAVININTGTTDALRKALNSATDGDEIVMAAGTYVESNSNYIAFTGKNITVRAAEGAEVILQPQVMVRLKEGATARFEGIKFDCSHLNELGSYSNVFVAADANDANNFAFENCEFYNFTVNSSLIYCSSSNKLASVSINNCYFHNIMKSCLFVDNTADINVQIKNSTFANISTDAGSYSAAPIDVRATNADFLVDHCTFYNVLAMNTDYAAVGKSTITNGVVSNSIFMLPESQDNIRAIRGVKEANNCLTFNYLKDSGKGIHSDVAKNNCIFANPLFADAANGNFSLAGNWVSMNISPARGAATDGSDLGDPRWYTAETLPSTDFASPYAFVGAKAVLSGNIWYDSENGYLYGDGGYNKDYGTATWKFHAEKACVLGIAVNLNSGNTSGHKLRVEVLDADGNSVAEFAEQESTLPGTLIIPSIGDYKIILHDDQEWSSAKIDNITLSYIGGDIQAMPGTTDISDAWFSANGTRADGKISFPGSTIQDGWVKWNVSFANTGNFNVTLNINSNNCKNYTVALVDANDANVVTPLTLNDCSTTGTPVALAMGAMEVPAGNYILKVTNATQNSDAELINVNFAYTGGGIIDIPGTIALNEAILSERAFIDGDGLHFVDAEHLWLMSEGYAKWNIHVAADGIYKFTANCNSSNYSNLTIQVLQGGEEKYTYTPQYTYSGEKTIVSPEWFLEAGNYELKLSNPANNSNGYLVSLVATAEENVFIMDENTTDDGSIAAAAGNTYKFLLKRSFTAERYYTICIPVGSWDDELKLAFGADYELWKMSSATQAGDEISLNFEQCNTESFHAGWPYLIKPSIDVQNPIFHNEKTIQNSTYNNVQTFAAADFIGSFYKTVIPAGESNLYLQNNNLYYSETNNTPIKGTRAWIQLKQSGSLAPARARIVLLNQVVTNIQLAEQEENKAIKTIENGQLIIIRDGVRYNAMGVIMK